MKKRIETVLFFFLLILAAFFSFYRLSSPALQEWDELTNVNVVYETLHSNNPFVLTYQGKPFFEKPPLWYYATIATTKLFGFSNVSLRIVSAISGFLLIILVYFIGNKLYSNFARFDSIESRRAGIIAGFIILATRHLFFFNPASFFSTHTLRSADSDALQILLITASFFAFYLVHTNKKWLYAAIFLCGLAVMTKGSLGFLPLATFILFEWISPKRIALSRSTIVVSVLILLATILPWHLLMYRRFHEVFIDQYFGYHLLQRIGSALENHEQPWWFYLSILENKSVFFSLELLVFALLTTFFKKDFWEYKHFAVVTIIALTFFTITAAETKLAWYILPIYPFAALCMGGFLADLFQTPFVKKWRDFCTRHKLPDGFADTIFYSFAVLIPTVFLIAVGLNIREFFVQ